MHSRSRYLRAKVKRKLNKKMYPIVAPIPIQYQLGSGKSPRDFINVTPNDSVEFSGT